MFQYKNKYTEMNIFFQEEDDASHQDDLGAAETIYHSGNVLEILSTVVLLSFQLKQISYQTKSPFFGIRNTKYRQMLSNFDRVPLFWMLES